MTEIKFRGITARNKNGKLCKKRWVYGYFYKGGWDFLDEDCKRSIIFDPKEREYPVILESVGQYTGLKDKNGNEIYEGDVVKRVTKDETIICPVVFVYGKFQLYKEGYGYYEINDEYHKHCYKNSLGWITEVIGNIYEDKYLLESEGE